MFSNHKILRGMTRASLAGALSLMLAASASAQVWPEEPAEQTAKDAVKLKVENLDYWDMHVYMMRDGYYRSLGVVPGLGTGEFSIPAYMALPGGDFEILADPVGSNLSYQTGPIEIGTAAELDVTLQSNLTLSSYTLKGNRVKKQESDDHGGLNGATS